MHPVNGWLVLRTQRLNKPGVCRTTITSQNCVYVDDINAYLVVIVREERQGNHVW